jgi:hypothetical protein
MHTARARYVPASLPREPRDATVRTVSRKRQRSKGAGLQLCLTCGSLHVIPVESSKIGGGGRWLLLRCGECGAWRQAIAPPGAARAFDQALEEGIQEISDTIERLDRDRMTAQAEAFIAALDRDLIDAGDFR